MDKNTLQAKAALFGKMHEGPDILILPNAWDVGSAVILAEAGFPAIATTSAGIAVARGFPDGEHITREEMLDNVARIVNCVSVPVTADLEMGYGSTPEEVGETIRQAIAAGVVGVNIEDGTGRREQPLMEVSVASERIRAAREAADAAGVPIIVNARADTYLATRERGEAEFEDTIVRANAYKSAGADCIFVPGIFDRELIGRIVDAVACPLNVLGALSGRAGMPLSELQELGVARVSIGGSLSLAALGLVRRVAQDLLGAGTFDYATDALSNAELNKLLSR